MKRLHKLFFDLNPLTALFALKPGWLYPRCKSKKDTMTHTLFARVQFALIALIVGAMLLSGTLARANEPLPSAAGDLYYDYSARIDSVNFHHIRSMRNDDDWLYYEIRVLDSNNNQLFLDKRDGHLTKPNGSAAIRNGDFIAFTHPQGQWENPFVLNFRLRETDVAVCTYTIINQSHESHDPNKQRHKWDKFVASQQKAVVIGEIIALPIGAGLAYASVSGAYLALLEGIGGAWDLISPPAEENVDCDGPVVTGYWKYTGADLLARTTNSRRTESFSGRFRDRKQARKECESVPDTEVFLSIEREQNMGGRFPTTPPPAINDRPASSAPSGVWAGTWVDQTDVSDSRIIVQVMNPSPARPGAGGLRLRQCNVTAEASYNVSIKELASPASSSIEFQQGSNCVSPEQASSQGASTPYQRSRRPDAMYEQQPKPGITTRRKAGTMYEQEPKAGTPRPPTLGVTPPSAVHVLKATPNISLELYEAYNNTSPVGYRLRYVRKADDGSVLKDVKLSPAGSPIR